MKRLLVIVIIMMGLGMCVTSLTYFNANRLTFVVEQFCRISTIGKVKSAFYYLTQDFQDEIMLPDFRDYLVESPFADYQSVSWTYRRKNEETGMLKGAIRTRDGHHHKVEIILRRENKRWKIDNLIEGSVNVREELAHLKQYRLRDSVPSN